MKKKRYIPMLLFFFLLLIINLFIWNFCHISNSTYRLSFDIAGESQSTFEFFYLQDGEWSTTGIGSYNYMKPGTIQSIDYIFPRSADGFRIDIGNENSVVSLSDIQLTGVGVKLTTDYNRYKELANDIQEVDIDANKVLVIAGGKDPYLVYLLSSDERGILESRVLIIQYIVNIILCIVFDLLLFVVFNKRKAVWEVVGVVFNDWNTIFKLAINDLKSHFSASFLGAVWAFVQPLMTVLVFWFVFQVGLRNSDIQNVPYIVWFAPAFLVWSFFADTLSSGANSLREYQYLVKKVNFEICEIPIIKVLSGSFIHFIFILLIILINLAYGNPISVYFLQVGYYFICTITLLIGFNLILSAITPFAGDVSNIVNVIIQIGFWATPIVWNPDNMSKSVQFILKLNPMFYICRGYRDSFIDKVWFWERGWTNVYFWAVTLFALLVGIFIFRKLKPHIADVL